MDHFLPSILVLYYSVIRLYHPSSFIERYEYFADCIWFVYSDIHLVTALNVLSFILRLGRKVRFHIYLECHSVCPLVRIGTPPHPLKQGSVLPPGTKGGGGGNTIACGQL